MSGTSTAYDEVLYPSAVYPQTHPDRLATIGSLLGLSPARLETARVLELGCGDGTNLITMASSLPGAKFYGIDLASSSIAKGSRMIEALGFSNVTLKRLDLMGMPTELGRFDYIIAHGLFSWVPPEARERIFLICEEHLSDQGIAYISYNAYPGNHLRDAVRQMMRFHTREFADPMEKVRQARSLVKFAAQAKTKPGLWENVMQQELGRIVRYTDAGFFHDDLSEVNTPFYFFEFIEHAARHGLQYLAEADLTEMLDEGLTEPARALISGLESTDFIKREQYLDFVKGRSFRQTLLCRQAIKVERQSKPERVCEMFAGADAHPANPEMDLSTNTSEDFRGSKGAVIATSTPVAKAALAHLGKAFPLTVHFQGLLARARQACGQAHESDAADLGEFLIRTNAVGFVELHSRPAAFVTHVSERPVASALARFQIQQGDTISTLSHRAYKLEGILLQTLLRLLDGTRDRAALFEALAKLVRSGAAKIELDGKPAADLRAALEILGAQLDGALLHFANAAVLVA
jgi:methyltransferase-like protein/trans-aconitate methyltransferase